jgi:predicted alpha/beta superfamily hydrolase
MKRILFFIVLLLITAGDKAYSQTEDIYFADRTDTIIDLKSKYFDFNRRVFIRLPQVYKQYTATDFDVIYMFDAQTKQYFDMVTAMPVFVNTNWADRFIVVGVCSPQTEKYSRQDDFVTNDSISIKNYRGHGGHCEDLALFVKNELQPYIKSHYRVTEHSLGIGHSLGASFLLEGMFSQELFDDYFAISPNMAFGKNRVANDFIHHDFSKPARSEFLFLSDAAEERIPHWENWKPAREIVYNYILQNRLPKNVTCVRTSYPAYDHMSCFPSALFDAFKSYFHYRDSVDNVTSSQTFHKHIELVVHNAKDEVFITGNQDVLGNWNPGLIKMKHVNDTVRAIDVDLRLPAQFKFTRGSWKSQAYLDNSYNGLNQMINNKECRDYHFVLDSWSDEFRE